MTDSRKKLKARLKKTLKEASKILSISPNEISRNIYVRITVDAGIEGRLNKEELNYIGGYKVARDELFPPIEVREAGPKILVYDIETSPIVAHVWRLWDNNVTLNQIVEDWTVLSWAAKWLGSPEDEVIYEDCRKKSEKKILEGIWKLLDETDIVLTQNGKKFDQKKLNARFIQHGMQPPSSYRHIDTLQIAKRTFGFTSNKLAYMTDKLCTKYKKLTHAKFPGFDLWKQCLAGNPEAWEEMRVYNIHDILSLEELYYVLAPWDNSINFDVYLGDGTCKCGNHEFKKSGFHFTNVSKFQKWKCTACGFEHRDTDNLLSKEERKANSRRITPGH